MASGAKRILLSPASPSLQSANKRIAVFPSPQRVAGGPKSPCCSTPNGLGNVSSATFRKRFAQSDEKPSRSRKKLFDFPRVDIPLTTNQLIDASPPESHIPCTPSCATPNEASSLYVDDRREHETVSLERKPLSTISNGQKLDSCRVPLLVENDTPLTTDELLLYALMITSFPTETFSKKHSVEKYERVVEGIHLVNGVHYSSQSVRNYFYRVRRNEVKGVGKSKGVCRWNYFKECVCKFVQIEARALGSLLMGEVLQEIAKVSLIENLKSCCAETVSRKSKEEKPDEKAVLTQQLQINEVHSIFVNDLKPALDGEWSFYENLNSEQKTVHFYFFGNCPGYAEREVKLYANGSWNLYVEGIQRDIEVEGADFPKPVKTYGDVVYLLNLVGNLKVCHGCDYQKYESFLPADCDCGKPVFMTRDNKPAAFVERLLTEGNKKIIRSTKCLIFIINDEILETSNCCVSCQSANHYLRTLKSRKNNPNNDSSKTKFEYMSKDELVNLARKSAKELKYLRQKAERLEEHRTKMTSVGPKSDSDLKYIFIKLHEGVDKTKQKLQNPICQWNLCEKRFQHVEELYCHCKEHIDKLDTAGIAPINRLYSCKWAGCTKTYNKLKLLQNHLRDHTGNARDEFLEILLRDQAKALNTPAKQMRWHPLVIQWCLKMYCKSHSMYNDMRLSGGLKLPSGRTLSDYRNFNAPKSGWHSSTLQAMKNRFDKMKAPKHAKLGGLFFDEVKIKEGLVFDSSTWELVGFTDIKDDNFESGTSVKSEIATHVLQFFFRSTFFKFDFPCAYFLTKGATSLQINRVFWLGVSMLHSYGFQVILSCCDGASPNRTFITMNTTNESHSKGLNPFSGQPIFFFSDPPHLMKKLRNNLYNSGFKDKHSRYTRNMKKNGKYIIWDHIYAVFNREKKRSLFATDLRHSHIHLDSLSKMRVKLAVQTLSSKVVADMSKFENDATSSTQEYIINCEKFWRVFNDSKPIRNENDARIQMLDEVLGYFLEWKESLPHLYHTKSEQGLHFIAWQTMFDLKVIYCKCMTEYFTRLFESTGADLGN